MVIYIMVKECTLHVFVVGWWPEAIKAALYCIVLYCTCYHSKC